MRKLSLRWRITLLTGIVLLVCTVALTITASRNAEHQFENIVLVPVEGVPPSTITLEPSTVVGTPFVSPSMDQQVTGSKQVTEAKKDFNTVSIVALVVISALGMVAVYFVSGKSLAPISDLSKQAEAITQYNLHERVPDTPCAAEINSLRQSFNAMLDRLDTSFQQQKQFSANVAHELKTPLATMSASVQVLHLDEHPSEQEYEKVLSTIEHNTQRLKEIVENLMQLCNEQPLSEVEQFDLQELVFAVTGELEPNLQERKISVTNDCGNLYVCGNRSMLHQAFSNLIENAIKYNHEGGSIHVSSAAHGQIGTIRIEDTGMGIPESELPHIFDPFYRVNKSRNRKTGGSGLGLSVVKTIVERHGWNITAESAMGVGTAFVISFYLG